MVCMCKMIISCLPCCAPNEIGYGKINVEINSGIAVFSVFFFLSLTVYLQLENVTSCSWNDCE